MARASSKSGERRNRTLKNMPDKLWEEMNQHVREIEAKQYAWIRDAIREKLERELRKLNDTNN
jgi:protein-arginine kinase activator protein McsA